MPRPQTLALVRVLVPAEGLRGGEVAAAVVAPEAAAALAPAAIAAAIAGDVDAEEADAGGGGGRLLAGGKITGRELIHLGREVCDRLKRKLDFGGEREYIDLVQISCLLFVKCLSPVVEGELTPGVVDELNGLWHRIRRTVGAQTSLSLSLYSYCWRKEFSSSFQILV